MRRMRLEMILAFVCAGREAAGPFQDGGMVDRTGLRPWRQHLRRQQEAGAGSGSGNGSGMSSGSGGSGNGSGKGLGKGLQRPPSAILHLIARSSKFSGSDNVAATGGRKLLQSVTSDLGSAADGLVANGCITKSTKPRAFALASLGFNCL